ncbi:hypothetical protein PR202_ga11108 [Eleusine coracana subsp. coracana]|uniref:Yippee domain-containing protein n=1 Tax=Eleusine coracana subsp. coracana TaxID=191504 RepID=A0AAV5C8T8_ELECO|nr:hypothetical protein PR202_ga11108 [Eleusine coracana subsp. coracana]
MNMEVNNNNHKEKDMAAVLERSLSAVTYCCGACGYDLRLRSSDRNTAGGIVVGGGHRRGGGGVVTFDAIDDARFGDARFRARRGVPLRRRARAPPLLPPHATPLPRLRRQHRIRIRRPHRIAAIRHQDTQAPAAPPRRRRPW